MDALVDAVLGTYPSWSHLVVRLTLGVIFVAHGAQKVLGWFGGPGLAGTITMMRGMRVPASAAVVAALVELLGGGALIVGLLVRPAAAGIIVIMAVAIAKVHGRHGFFLTAKTGPGYEFNLALIGMALSLVIGGAGILSLDDWLWLVLSVR
jgi:putative oxidoreductase